MTIHKPTVFFYFPCQPLVDSIPATAKEYWEWLVQFKQNHAEPGFTGVLRKRWTTACHWTVQTFIYLRESGFDCELTASLPEEGIVLTHRHCLSRFQKPTAKQFLVEIKPDFYLHCIYANFVIVQNSRDPIRAGIMGSLVRSAVVDNWPQPGLIPRDHKRGDRFENICYMGHRSQFIEEFDVLESEIRQLGLRWVMVQPDKWNDYSEADALVAVRRPDPWGFYLRKPVTRLTNAWAAGVPAILSPDPAFEDIRSSELDYLSATSVEEVVEQVKRLRDNPSLRQAMSENGRKRAVEYTAEKNVQKWTAAISGPILHEYHRWTESAGRRTTFYLLRTLADLAVGIDRDPRPREARYPIDLSEPDTIPAALVKGMTDPVKLARDYLLVRRSGLFDPKYYLEQNPDVRKSRADPLIHYMRRGWREGRDPSAEFDTRRYLASNSEARDAGINPLVYYIRFGSDE